MSPDERKALAEQITTNPLYVEVMDAMERDAIERLIHEREDIVLAQLRVKAIRTFREALGEALNTPARKGAPV